MKSVFTGFLTMGAFAAALTAFGAAKTVYVDCKLDDYTGHDGTSWEKAVKTLADGVAKCSDGDTMLVAKGVYDEGYRAFNAQWGKARLEFCNKHFYVKAVAGPLETFLVGEKCTLTDNGDGTITTNYVRCVQLYNAKNSVLEGFTLMNGDTGIHPTLNHNRNGSVVCTDSDSTLWLVNCNITGNYGEYDMIRYSNLVNCNVTNNFMETTQSGRIFEGCNLLNTRVANNFIPQLGDLFAGAGNLVNCTLVNNRFVTAVNSKIVLYNTIVTASGNLAPKESISSVTGVRDYPIMSSLGADIRVRSGSTAETAGNGKYRTATYFPSHPEGWVSEDWRTKDLFGNAVSTEDTTIMAGCLQATGTQAGRAIFFGDSDWTFSLDGGEYSIGRQTYFIPETYPTQVVIRVKMADTQRLVSLYVKNSPVSRLTHQFPEPNEDYVIFRPEADTTTTTAYEINAHVGTKVWTDPELDDYTAADGSEEHPYETLQDALDQTTGKIVIMAKPGTYAKGGVANASQQGRLSNYRLYLDGRTVRLIGTAGAASTIIKGAPDPDTLTDSSLQGCGPNGYKCIGSSNSVYCVEGVTLTGGYSNKPSKGVESYSIMGGGVTSIDNHALVQNSIISNNYAHTYSAAYYVRLNRCIVRDNHSSVGVAHAAVMTACVLGPNDMNSGSQLSSTSSYAMNTTIIGPDKLVLADSGVNLYNAVLVNGASTYANSCHGSVIWNVSTVTSGTTGYVQVNPYLCEVTDGYGRPFKGSPALTAGDPLVNANMPEVPFYLKTDMDGNVINPTAAVNFAGAYRDPVATGVYVADATGLDGVESGVNYPSAGGSTVEIAPKSGSSRPIVGATVNGVATYFNDTTDGKFVYDAAAIAAGNVIVSAALTSNAWYVDDDGSDTNDGYFPKQAKKTLKAALENVNLAQNDRVLVLPGTYSYDDGTMQQANFGERTVESVAAVPNYVTLESTEGAEVTIIQGKAGDTEDPKYYDPMTSMHGIGPGAVRCVYLGLNSVVKGFTLKDGHTRANKDSPIYTTGTIHSDREFNGGGVTGAGNCSYGKVVSCIIDNCAAFRGGAAFAVTCYNCEFKNNFAIYGGGASSDSVWAQCLSHDNSCYNSSYRAGYFYGNGCFSSTIIDSFGDVATEARANMVTNCLFYGQYNPCNSAAFDVSNIRNCVFNKDASTTVGTAAWENLHASSRRVSASELQLDANYRPVLGANVAIDLGTPDVMNASGFAPYCETDKDGGQRVYNGTVDVGCYEADWRRRYATDIAKRNNFVVTEVSPSVIETAEGTVRLPIGATLKAELTKASTKPRTVSVRVTGTGTLTVKLNDAILGTQVGAGTATFEVDNALATNALEFNYTGDDGSAEILSIRRNAGLLIILN